MEGWRIHGGPGFAEGPAGGGVRARPAAEGLPCPFLPLRNISAASQLISFPASNGFLCPQRAIAATLKGHGSLYPPEPKTRPANPSQAAWLTSTLFLCSCMGGQTFPRPARHPELLESWAPALGGIHPPR